MCLLLERANINILCRYLRLHLTELEKKEKHENYETIIVVNYPIFLNYKKNYKEKQKMNLANAPARKKFTCRILIDQKKI